MGILHSQLLASVGILIIFPQFFSFSFIVGILPLSIRLCIGRYYFVPSFGQFFYYGNFTLSISVEIIYSINQRPHHHTTSLQHQSIQVRK